MAQKKAHEVDSWLSRPDPRMGTVLVYGPDRGLVSERAGIFVRSCGLSPTDPFAVVRLSGDDVDQDPGRLHDEMATLPMFSDKRLVWVQAQGASKGLADAVRILSAGLRGQSLLLIEAGDLKKTAPLRVVVEESESGMALPCYADEARALDAMIDAALASASLTITLEARSALKQNLGGDRLASRSEIDKLVLYAQGQGQIGMEDIEALAGDASGPSVDATLDAVLLGRVDQFDTMFSRLASTNQLGQVLNAGLRQFQALETLRATVESGGKTPAAAVAGARPPIFFARRQTMETVLGRWSLVAIRRAQERLQQAVWASRAKPALATALVRHAMLGLAIEAQRRNS